jgi:hypothetical protein
LLINRFFFSIINKILFCTMYCNVSKTSFSIIQTFTDHWKWHIICYSILLQLKWTQNEHNILHLWQDIPVERQFQKCPVGGSQELKKQATLVPNAVTFDSFIQSPHNLIQVQLTCRGTSPKKNFPPTLFPSWVILCQIRKICKIIKKIIFIFCLLLAVSQQYNVKM